MEMWIHGARIEGLGLWLSGALRIQVNLASLDRLNLQLSACGFSLHKDTDKNYIFRVSYTGCFVRQQHGNNVLVLNLMKRIHRFGGRPHSFIMKCPVVSIPPNREHIQCDPEYIQVTRQVPHDSWNNELHWSLSLRGNLIVALEDASLIQVNVDLNGPDLTVQGRRGEILSPVTVMENEGEFLALKLVSGQYAYSMEATCPSVTKSTAEEAVLHIFKRCMGLTKRGGYETETLTVSSVSVNQTDTFTVHETSEFVQLIIPTAQILQTKTCTDNIGLWQPFYRVDVVLTFKETHHKMHWTMENTLPCTARPAVPYITSPPGASTTAPAPPVPTIPTPLESLPPEPPSAEPSTVPAVKPNEATADSSTTNSPYVETEASGLNFHIEEFSRSQRGNVSTEFVNGTTATINTTETESLDFQAAATVSSSAQLEVFGSSQPSAASFLTMIATEQTDTKNSTQPVEI